MNKTLRYLASILKQTRRNLRQTWGTQVMMLLTVSLSVLIFTFFFLVYTNLLTASEKLNDDVRLSVFFNDELDPILQKQIKEKITTFTEVEKIVYVSKQDAWNRLTAQLGEERDVLEDLGPSFLPTALEVYPQKKLASLAGLDDFSNYLATLPGAVKVQYGKEWLSRFSSFTHLLRIITGLSAVLLVLTTTFMVAYTIRLTVFIRKDELEILRLLGASDGYIKIPLLLEGIMHGIVGSCTGLFCLYFLFQWITIRFSGEGTLMVVNLHFFPQAIQLAIVAISVILCVGGSSVSIRKFLRI